MRKLTVYLISYFIFLVMITYFLIIFQKPIKTSNENVWVIRKPSPYEYTYNYTKKPHTYKQLTREQILCKWLIFAGKKTYYDPILNVTWHIHPELKACSYLTEAH